MVERTGAMLWMCCAQFFIAEQVARSAWNLPYSFAKNFISDLGNTICDQLVCSPWHAVMNGSFALQGLLIAGGAIVAWVRTRGFGRVPLALLMLCGLGTLVVGFVPENANGEWHQRGAAMHFLAGGLAMIAAGWAWPRRFGWASAVLGIIVLAATWLLGQRTSAVVNQLGVGSVERVAAYGIAGWMVFLGIYTFFCSTTFTVRSKFIRPND